MSLHQRIDEFDRIEEKLKSILKGAIVIETLKLKSIIPYLGTNETYNLTLDPCKNIGKRHKCKVKLICDERILGELSNPHITSCNELLSKAYKELESVSISEIEKYSSTTEELLENKLSEIIKDPAELIIIPGTPNLTQDVHKHIKIVESILKKFPNPILVAKKTERTENSKNLNNILVTFSYINDLEAIIPITLAIADPKAKITMLKIMDDRFMESVDLVAEVIAEEIHVDKEKLIESIEKQVKKILNDLKPKIAKMGYKVDFLIERGETVHKISETAEKINASLIVIMHKFNKDVEAEVKLFLDETNKSVLITSSKNKL